MLIYKGPNWMDDSNAYSLAHLRIENDPLLNTAQILHSKEMLSLKYERRYRKGDPVDVYIEGTITEPPSPDNKCVALRIKDLDVEVARKYLAHLEDAEGIIRRRRKFQILWDDLPQNMKDQLRDERFLIVTKSQAVTYIREHMA